MRAGKVEVRGKTGMSPFYALNLYLSGLRGRLYDKVVCMTSMMSQSGVTCEAVALHYADADLLMPDYLLHLSCLFRTQILPNLFVQISHALQRIFRSSMTTRRSRQTSFVMMLFTLLFATAQSYAPPNGDIDSTTYYQQC